MAGPGKVAVSGHKQVARDQEEQRAGQPHHIAGPQIENGVGCVGAAGIRHQVCVDNHDERHQHPSQQSDGLAGHRIGVSGLHVESFHIKGGKITIFP